MIKKRILLLVTVLLISIFIVYAESSFQRGELEEGESIIYNVSEGFYILTLVAVSDQTGTAIFRLNDEMSDKLREKESYTFRDGSDIVARDIVDNEAAEGKDFAGYYLYTSGNEPMKVKLYSINTSVCNFDKRCENETEEYCCHDCGCGGGYDCINNVCNIIGECEEDNECDDFNACTADSCFDGDCRFVKKEGCELGNKCVEEGYVNNERYCRGNEWFAQKENNKKCDNDYECISGGCKDDKCIKKSESKGVVLFVLILLLLTIVAYTRRDFIIRKLKRRVI